MSRYKVAIRVLDQKIGTLVWSPLSFGLLSGKYKRGGKQEKNSRLAKMEPPGTVDFEKVYQIVDVLEDIAQQRGKTVPQVSLRWLLQRKGISSVIIGARTEEQLKENLGAAGWKLDATEMERLQKASAVPEIYPYWHQHKWGEDRNPSFM